MKKSVLKEFAILLGLIVVVAIAARVMARGETLEEYGKKRAREPEASMVAGSEAASEAGVKCGFYQFKIRMSTMQKLLLHLTNLTLSLLLQLLRNLLLLHLQRQASLKLPPSVLKG